MKKFALGASFFGLLALGAVQADAQRFGGRGGRAGASAARSMPATSNRSIRSSASANVNRGNINRVGNRANINTGDINVHRDVDVNVDVDHGWSHWDDHWHPVAAATTAAVVTAAVVGTYYRTLPANCVIIYRGTVTYYQCGTVWYQPVYSGATVQYLVVTTP